MKRKKIVSKYNPPYVLRPPAHEKIVFETIKFEVWAPKAYKFGQKRQKSQKTAQMREKNSFFFDIFNRHDKL